MGYGVGRRGCCVEVFTRVRIEQQLVQILVVVAIIQMRSLKADEEKVSMRTALGHG